MRELTVAQARRMRLVAHAFGAPGRTPAQAVERMVAMQGQDLPAVLRAIAIRSAPGTTIADVRAAFDRGELVRSWAMRGTLFVATPGDLAVLHAATAARMRPQEWRMCELRDIDEAIAARAAEVLVGRLEAGPTRRPALLEAWQAAGIDTAGGRGYHLLALLAYDGLVRFGPFDGSAQLLVGGPPPPAPDPMGALDEALVRFAQSRAPVRPDDAAWWLGLPKRAIRASLERASDTGAPSPLERVLVGDEPMLVATGSEPPGRAGVMLVPGFDEWLLGYQDRSLVASPEALAAIVPGGNGVFRPAVLVDGRVVGSWRWPAAGGRDADPLLELVEAGAAGTRAAIERALRRWPHR